MMKIADLRKKVRIIIIGKPILSRIASIIKNIYLSKSMKIEIEKVIAEHSTQEQINDKKLMRSIKRDILFMDFYCYLDPTEYFQYNIYGRPLKIKKEYIGKREIRIFNKKVDDPESKRILGNKWETYRLFSDYFKRDAILIKEENDFDIFRDFCLKHNVIFVKPLDKCGGIGITKYEMSQDSDIESIFSDIINEGEMIVEEEIIQAPELARYHPGSINTVRIVTLCKENEVSVIQTILRVGEGDSFVDNVSSGGLFAEIDKNTGVIASPGFRDFEKTHYDVHPDTNVAFVGSQIPEWTELIGITKELALRMPKQPLVGWDMAYSNRGWVMVEGNKFPGIQILSGEGVGARGIYKEIARQLSH